ncbi:MAG: N-acetylmuramic acid 6-phosphate etherase [Solirubrobacteraceae bacterium]
MRARPTERPATEGMDPDLVDLDRLATVDVVRAVVGGHDRVLSAVQAVERDIAALAEAAAERMGRGGRVLYVGAGSAGRVGLLDAAEWSATFGVQDDAVVALMAGDGLIPGCPEEAAAEDDRGEGATSIARLGTGPDDVVVGLSASGRTPYVLAAMAVATGAGALTAAVTCERGSELSRSVDVAIQVPVGPEAISGSTRLKAATAQKLVLNAFSTAVMVRRGRTLGNLMACMRVSNEKLRDRAIRICVTATGCTEKAAADALAASGEDLPVAVVSLARGVDAREARGYLDASGGAIGPALGRPL